MRNSCGRVQGLARRKKLTCEFVADKGKGSHGRLYVGGECTTLKDRKKEIGRVLVEFDDLPRVSTDGKDDREAMAEAVDALGSDLSIRLSRREEIPAPSAGKRGQRLVPVPLWLAPKLALYLAMRDQQVTNSELARRIGVHERVIRRMLDPQHASKPEKIQAALAALGKQVTVEVGDAA